MNWIGWITCLCGFGLGWADFLGNQTTAIDSEKKSCLKCYGLLDYDCRENVQSVTKYECKNNNDFCYTYINFGSKFEAILSRGCLQELPEGLFCDQTQESCRICSGENCNDEQFPLVTECFHCSLLDCAKLLDNSDWTKARCQILDPDNYCLTIFEENKNSVSKRGCYDFETEWDKDCENNFCEKCQRNLCNNREPESKNGICFKCGPDPTDDNCLFKLPSNLIYECQNENDQCITYHKWGMKEEAVFIRGCLRETSNITKCPGPNCKICSGPLCNFEKQHLVHSCYACNSLDGGSSCRENQVFGRSSSKICDYLGPENECVAYQKPNDHSLFIRDCLKDMKFSDNLCERNSLYCQNCKSNFCNNRAFQLGVNNSEENCVSETFGESKHHFDRFLLPKPIKTNHRKFRKDDKKIKRLCYSCNTYLNYDYCLKELDETMIHGCSNYSDNCIMYLEWGHNPIFIRGCRQEMPKRVKCDGIDGDCILCGTNLCNSEPMEAVSKCFVCRSNDGDQSCINDQIIGANNTKTCELLRPDNQCVTAYKVDDPMFMERDCYNENRNLQTLCGSGRFKCEFCKTNFCNSQRGHTRDLACIQCNEHDPKCLFKYLGTGLKTKCKNSMPGNHRDQCFRYTFANIGTRYGCLSDDPRFCLENDCYVCSDVNCNEFYPPAQKCTQCSSERDSNCKTNPYVMPNKICRYPNNFGYMGCYLRVDGDNHYRGCLTDMSFEDFRDCRLNEQCYSCLGENCNRYISKASKITRLVVFNIILLSLLTRLL